MDYDNVRTLRDLFDSGTEMVFEDKLIKGNVLYFDSNICYIQVNDKEFEINLDDYSMLCFKTIKRNTNVDK